MNREAPIPHDEAVSLLPDFVRDRGPIASRSGVEAHVEACEECRGLVETYRRVSGALRAEGSSEPLGHLPASDIVSCAVNPGAVPPADAERITFHLRDCLPCREEVEVTRGADRATRSVVLAPPARIAAFPPAHWKSPAFGALAAALLLGVLGYPAFLGLVRLPEVRSEVESLRAALNADRQTLGTLQASVEAMRDRLRGLGSWTGAVDLVVLEGPARSLGQEPTVRIETGQPFALVGVLPPRPAGDAGSAAYLFEIDAPAAPSGPSGGAPAWSAQMTTAQIRARLARDGMVSFLIPADSLSTGRHVLRFRRAGDPREADLLRAPFVVAR